MKRKLLIPVCLVLAALLFPFTSFAGDDVTINDSVGLSVNGAGLSITSGAKINKIVAGSTNFTTTMTGTSTIKVTSGGRKKLSVTPSNMAANETCNSSESSVTIGASSSATPVAVTVEVSTDTCGGSGSSSGSGGGGGSVVGLAGSPSPAPVPPPTPTPAVVAPPAAPVTAADAARIVAAATAALNSAPPPATGVSSGGAVSAVFTRNLGPGVTNSDVMRLQQLLNSDPDTRIAESGAGSPGHESGFYGALTVAAVQKFQSKYDLISEGTPSTTGFGAFGPKTRAAIEMHLGGAMSEPSSPAPAPTAGPIPSFGDAPVVYLTNALAKGKTHDDVKSLQLVLNSDSETQIASSGTGSPGHETDYFGAMTEKAVQKFQVKYELAAPGDPGYGTVGPKTRAKINELFGQHEGSTMMSTPTPAVASAGGSSDDIHAQINTALKKITDLQTEIGGQTVTAPPAPTPLPASTSADTSAIEKQIQDAMKKIQEISAQIKAQS